MNALELWQALRVEHPARVGRVAHQCEPVEGTSSDFIELLARRSMNASIAAGKCGWVGNPYEQLDEDFGVLLEVAQRLRVRALVHVEGMDQRWLTKPMPRA
jgi:hypothetical protein